MLKIITHLKKIHQISGILEALEQRGYTWMWKGKPEGILPTKFIGWKFLVVRQRRMDPELLICMIINENTKKIIELGNWIQPKVEYCTISHSEFLWELYRENGNTSDSSWTKEYCVKKSI